MTKQHIRWAIVAFILMSPGCGDRSSEPPAHSPGASENEGNVARKTVMQPSQVVRDRLRTEAVGLHAVPEIVQAPGEVALDLKQVAKVTSRIEGQADQIPVQLGDHVKKGQALAVLKSLQFDQLIEEYLVANAQANVAENSFQRTQKLRADDIVPERKLVEDRGRHLEMQARFQHIREKLLNMGLSAADLKNLERGSHEESHRYTVTSPIAGTVVEQHVVRGQGVAPGNELFEVVDTSRVWIFANLSIEQARKYKEGDMGTITPKGGSSVKAPLTYIAPVADETTRTVRLRFETANVQAALKPREYVDVTLELTGSPIVAVPITAVTSVDNQRGVFVERDTGYAFVPIDVGREGGGWIEVRKGVSQHDRVVMEGVFDLKNVLLKEHIGSGE